VKLKYLNLVDRWEYTCLDTAYDVGNSDAIAKLEALGAKRNLNFIFNASNTNTIINNSATLNISAQGQIDRTNTINITNFLENQDISMTVRVLNAV